MAGKQFQGKVLDSKESKIVIELLDAETNETIQEQLVKVKLSKIHEIKIKMLCL